jgi:hypothetical protein
MVEFKNVLRQHLKRGEIVVGNNYVRVMKSPNTYDATETWCDGSVSVRLIVTSYPRLFFIDLPSDQVAENEKRENNCCVPAFEFSDNSFFGNFFTGSNDAADVQEDTVEFRKKAVQQISKEQKMWDSSSHPDVVENSVDSLEVAFRVEAKRNSLTPTGHRRVIVDADKHLKQNTYVFIDEINGSRYWANIFNELKHTNLLSSDSETHTTIIEKEAKVKTPKVVVDGDVNGVISATDDNNTTPIAVATRLFIDEDSIEVYSHLDKQSQSSVPVSQPVSAKRGEITAILYGEITPTKTNPGEYSPLGKTESKTGPSTIDLNIRQKIPSRASMRITESSSTKNVDKDLFLKNWDDESYRMVSSGLGSSNSNNRKSMNYTSLRDRERGVDISVRQSLPFPKSAKTDLDVFIRNWDSDQYKMVGSGLAVQTEDRTSSRTMSPVESTVYGLQNPASEKRKNSKTQDTLGELTSMMKGEVFVRNFDHDAYKRCGSGLYGDDSGTSSPNPSGTPPKTDDILRSIADIKRRSNNSSFRIGEASPRSSSPNPSSLSPAPAQFPNNFSPKVLFGSQIVKLRKVPPKSDDDADVSMGNSSSMYALKGGSRPRKSKKNKAGTCVLLYICMHARFSLNKNNFEVLSSSRLFNSFVSSPFLSSPLIFSPLPPSPHFTSPLTSSHPSSPLPPSHHSATKKGNNDEIPSPSLKDGAALAKWKLDRQNRPISSSGNSSVEKSRSLLSKIGDGEKGFGDYYDDEEEEGTSYRDEGEKDDSDDSDDDDDDDDEEEEVLDDNGSAIEATKQDEKDGNKENTNTPNAMKSDQNFLKDDLYSAYGAYEQNDGREKEKGVFESKTDKGFVTTAGVTGEKVVGEVAQYSVLPLGHQLVQSEEMRVKRAEEKLMIEKKKLGIAAMDERKAYEEKKERELKENEMKKEREEMKAREEEKQREELKESEKKEKEMEEQQDKEKQEKIEKDKQEKDKLLKEKEEKGKEEAMKAAREKESDRNVPSLEVQKLFLGNIPEGKYGSFPEEDSFLDNENTPDGEGVRGSAGNEVENAMLIVVDDDEASVKGNLSRRSSALNYFGRDRSRSNISEKETEERLDHMFEFERLGSLKKLPEDNNNDTEVSTDDSKTVGGKKKTFFGNLLKKLNPIKKKKTKTETN